MRLYEIAEAIAILRTPKGTNLDQGEIVTYDKIMDSCMSLVRRTRSGNKPDGSDYILLSHSSVWIYLTDEAAVASKSSKTPMVQRHLVRDCMIRYLLQPRYFHLLQRVNGEFHTQSPVEPVARHHLLTYAAKYWFQHCDVADYKPSSVSPHSSTAQKLSEPDRQQVRGLLMSPNFRTCIQVQGVFIIGNFLHRSDPLTDRDIVMRRTLPHWVLNEDRAVCHAYFSFMSDWYHLLSFSRDSPYIGEIDRCFWGSIGSSSFLAGYRGRYNSLVLGSVDAPSGITDTCRVQHLSLDGTVATMMWIRKEG